MSAFVWSRCPDCKKENPGSIYMKPDGKFHCFCFVCRVDWVADKLETPDEP